MMHPHLQRLFTNTFVCFSFVGSIGFVVDSTVLYLLILTTGMDLYTSRAFSFFCAASTTWLLNRSITFKHAGSQGQPPLQWSIYLMLMLIGGSVNYSVYALCVWKFPIVHSHPILGIAAGALSGLMCNYFTSRSLFLGRLSSLSRRSTTRASG